MNHTEIHRVTEDDLQQPCKLFNKQYGNSLVTGPSVKHKKSHDIGGTSNNSTL